LSLSWMLENDMAWALDQKMLGLAWPPDQILLGLSQPQNPMLLGLTSLAHFKKNVIDLMWAQINMLVNSKINGILEQCSGIN